MSDVPVALIAAVARNGVIGDGGRIPWWLSTDMRRFRRLTMGKPLVMGRKTYESLPGLLSGRPHIVIGRMPPAEGVEVCGDVESALATAAATAERLGADEIMVIGGGAVYAATIGRADRLYVTHVDLAPTGDALFPAIDPAIWRETGVEEVAAGPKDDAATRFVTYGRV